jgi:hypothetical protein
MANRLIKTDSSQTPPNLEAAVAAADRLTEGNPQPEPAEQSVEEKTRYINLRFKPSEYKQIGHIATDGGVSNTTFCRMAAMYMVDLVKSGVYTFNAGGFVPAKKG